MNAQPHISRDGAQPLGAPTIDAVRAAWSRVSSTLREGGPWVQGANQVGQGRVHAPQETNHQSAEGETIMGSGGGASACQEVCSRDGAALADPHGQVTSQMDSVLERLVKARAHMLRGEVVAKGEAISRCVAIIGGLRDCLGPEVGPTLTGRLDSLYEYMSRRLLQANLRDDATIIDEVSKLLHQVRDSWAQIAPAPASHAVEA